MRSTPTAIALVALAGALSISSCKKAPVAADAVAAAPAETAADTVAKAAPKPASQPLAGPMLAYAYRYEIEASADGVSAMARRQEEACTSAGPAACQVLGSDVAVHEGEASGSLRLRATAAWIAAFRGGLDAQVRAAGGRVVDQHLSTEDLARSIVDTGAELRAKTLLRDRLEQLLAQRPGKLEELLQLEKQIADVQGEIDATQSELTAMQGRVQMQELTLNYRSKSAPLGPRVTGPLARAFGGFLGHAIGVSAALVTLASYLLPLAMLGGFGWWATAWVRRRPARPAKS